MKKLFLMGALALAGVMSAQTAKGGWVIDAKSNLNFTNTSVGTKVDGKTVGDKAKKSTFNIAPSAAYFVIDNLAVGADLNFKTTTEGDDTESMYTVRPTATYYFGSTEFRPYLGAGVGYGGVKAGKDSEGGLTWGVKGGVVYLINSTIGVNAGVGYDQLMLSQDKTTITKSDLGVNLGLSLFL